MTTLDELKLLAPPAAGYRKTAWATVNEDGSLVLPPELAAKMGLTPGVQLRVDEGDNSLRLHRPVTHLAKLYVEPTDACNLDCVTCFRNAWDEPMGRMSDATFDAILSGLTQLDTLPTVYFGGIGEPLFHRRTTEWIAQVKNLGARVEMITNGTLLTEKRCRELIEADIDLVWVSIDGSTPESYADVRLGAELPNVIANVKRLRSMRKAFYTPKPQIGVAFVAMKRNIDDLPNVLKLARQLGALYVSVSNVLPIDEAMQDEVLYSKTLRSVTYIPSGRVPRLNLPKMDFDDTTRDALFAAFNSGYNVSYAGNNWGGSNDVCDYIEKGSMTIAWNGNVSPCWPLMHTHDSYLHGKVRRSYRHIVGNVRERSLEDLWLDPEYIAYRQRVQSFAFPPCTFCGGCDLSVANEEDCISNEFPVCGGCMWAQGVVQCP
jgi:MoaA/NifB/PqqE/SkfB family radical SAM enzyme